MSSIVKIKYDSDTHTTTIASNDKVFDTTRINGKEIAEWVYPFMIKNVRWNGIYDEIKDFLGGEEDFCIQFSGDENELNILKEAIKSTPANVAGTNNKVVILYKSEPLSTKITVNGQVFDTTRIQNRYIDEWVNPFQIRDIQWDGIFNELENYIHSNMYSIQFVGNAEDMKVLINACPENIDVTFRAPAANGKKSSGSGQISKPSINVGNVAEGIGNIKSSINAQNISDASKQVMSKIKQDINDEEIEKNLQNIPIKNEFVRKNAMAICAIISLIFTALPFISFSSSSEFVDTGSSFTGIEVLSQGSKLAFVIFVGPILLIIMNYIQQLKPYRRIISVVIPALCAIFEILAALGTKSVVNSVSGIFEEVGVSTSTHLQIGFYLLLLSYILTAVVGFMTYYGLELPIKKDK
jgi:hypothetical protein